jgi:hypothetical protein
MVYPARALFLEAVCATVFLAGALGSPVLAQDADRRPAAAVLRADSLGSIDIADDPVIVPVDRPCGPRLKGWLFSRLGSSVQRPLECQEMRTFSSAATCATAELNSIDETAASTLVISPDRCGDLQFVAPDPGFFRRCIDEHDAITDFLVTPGDYSAWGPLAIVAKNGQPQRKRVIRYFGPSRGSHPAVRAMRGFDNQAIIESIHAENAHHWIIHGLTVTRAEEIQDLVQVFPSALAHDLGSSRIILDELLVEGTPGLHAIQIRNSSDNCVQNCVIRNATLSRLDRVGVYIKTSIPNDPPAPLVVTATGNVIANNEIVNHGDAIQLGHTKSLALIGRVDGTIIEENDLYVTPEYIDLLAGGDQGCIENAIDIKVGAHDAASPVRIRNNRIWGYRAIPHDDCGGGGEAIVVHCEAKNVRIEQNVIFGLPLGIRTEKWFETSDVNPGECSVDNMNPTRGVLVEGNVFYDIHAFPEQTDADLNGVVLRIGTPAEHVRRNFFAHCETLLRQSQGMQLGELEENEGIAIGEVPPQYVAPGSTNLLFEASQGANYTFGIKRWTCPTTARLQQAYSSRPDRP